MRGSRLADRSFGWRARRLRALRGNAVCTPESAFICASPASRRAATIRAGRRFDGFRSPSETAGFRDAHARAAGAHKVRALRTCARAALRAGLRPHACSHQRERRAARPRQFVATRRSARNAPARPLRYYLGSQHPEAPRGRRNRALNRAPSPSATRATRRRHAEEARPRETAACVRIQSCCRGFVVRKALRRADRAARVIQARSRPPDSGAARSVWWFRSQRRYDRHRPRRAALVARLHGPLPRPSASSLRCRAPAATVL